MALSSVQVAGEIIGVEKITHDIFRQTILAPEIAHQAVPGQFLMVRIGFELDPLLRRPFSIHQIREDEGTLQILFKVIGKGTRLLSQKREGETLDLLGPLGKGFNAQPDKNILVGGGIGVAPLLFLADWLANKNPGSASKILLGARTREEIEALTHDFAKITDDLLIATDDGSMGHHGFIPELLEKVQPCESKPLTVYSCGPYPMLKKVVTICRKKGWNAQVSLEAMMACGISACLGCAVKKAAGKSEKMSYLHVCKDGPVFHSEEVDWNE